MSSPRPIRISIAALAAALAALTALPTTASAQQAGPGAAAAAAAAAAAPDPIRAYVERQMQGGVGRVTVTVGSLDPRLTLAPCQRVEPYMLPGTRLWGRTAIGVRCLEGASWTVALPITVTVHGKALVAGAPLAAGSVPSPAALRLEDIELTREAGTPVTDPAQLVGRSLIRPVATGQVLRMEHLRVTPTVVAGDPVRIQMTGAGFAIQADGQALVAAGEGQPIRVRTENGRILAGTLRGRTVEIRI
jgi:flagella basal body P-ring formation protein FlgA